jgi:hypothetical protein
MTSPAVYLHAMGCQSESCAAYERRAVPHSPKLCENKSAMSGRVVYSRMTPTNLLALATG